jgi:hypothetical protein
MFLDIYAIKANKGATNTSMLTSVLHDHDEQTGTKLSLTTGRIRDFKSHIQMLKEFCAPSHISIRCSSRHVLELQGFDGFVTEYMILPLIGFMVKNSQLGTLIRVKVIRRAASIEVNMSFSNRTYLTELDAKSRITEYFCSSGNSKGLNSLDGSLWLSCDTDPWLNCHLQECFDSKLVLVFPTL